MRPLSALLALIILAIPTLAQQAIDQLVGSWAGEIKLAGSPIGIAITFSHPVPDTVTALLDIPQQGVRNMPLDAVVVNGDKVSFKAPKLSGNASFEGALAGDDHQELRGTFHQAGFKLPFELKKGATITKKLRPQDPKEPFPYDVEQVTIPAANLTLAATITKPKGDGPFPALILISGSGPQNRDEELMNHRPFAVLADHLSRQGILVLRYDDRGTGDSTGAFKGSTTSDFADDAQAALRFLKTRKEVSKLGLLGHSEGGLIAPMVAARDKDVDFIILLAGPGVSGRDCLIEQNRAIMKANGATDETIEQVGLKAAELFDAVLADAPRKELEDKTVALAQAQSGGKTPALLIRMGIKPQVDALDDPWFRTFLALDPRENLRKVTVPVLAINGEKDIQVSAAKDLPEIEKALKEAGNQDITIKPMPNLNHLFQTANTGAVAEYATIDETMSPDVLTLISDWIKHRFK